MSENGRKSATSPDEEGADSLGRLIARAGRRPEPPESLEAQVRAAVRDEWQRVTDRRRRRNFMIVAAAAAVAFAAVGVGVLRQLPAPGASEPIGEVVRFVGDVRFIEPDGNELRLGAGSVHERLCARCEVATAAESGVNLAIAGGVSVRVGPATHLAWNDSETVRVLAGAIYIDAPRRGPGSPASAPAIPQLTVHTDYGRVAHVGTQYAVMVVPSGLTVRVREGTVVLDASRAREMARAAEEVRIDRRGMVTRSRVPTYGASWSWAEALAGEFDVTGRSVLEFLQWVSRETGRPVQFASEELRRQAAAAVLQGSTRGMSVNEALDSVMATTTFATRITDGHLVVEQR